MGVLVAHEIATDPEWNAWQIEMGLGLLERAAVAFPSVVRQ
jgi:hypothetical protein